MRNFCILILLGAIIPAHADVFEFTQDEPATLRTVGGVELLIYSSNTGLVTIAVMHLTGPTSGYLMTGDFCESEPSGQRLNLNMQPGMKFVHVFRPEGDYRKTITGFSSQFTQFTDSTWENQVTLFFPDKDFRDCESMDITVCISEGHELTGKLTKTPDNTLVADPAVIINMQDWATQTLHEEPMAWDEETQCWKFDETQLLAFGSSENPGINFRSVYTYPKETLLDRLGRPKRFNNQHFVEVCMYVDAVPHPISTGANVDPYNLAGTDWYNYHGDHTIFGTGDFRVFWDGIDGWIDDAAPDFFRQCYEAVNKPYIPWAWYYAARLCHALLPQAFLASHSIGQCIRQPIDHTNIVIPGDDGSSGYGPLYDILVDIVIPPLYGKDSHISGDPSQCEGYCYP